ncbi:MAG: hypothetical protein J1F07_06050 [Muribaculaceae bacterium]|nr:hypothetical protein [Muribaculaceae bacterium]
MAPITIREAQGSNAETTLGGVGLPGVTLALPSGLRAHFGQGSERVLHAFMYSLAESCRLNSVNIQDYFICLFSSARSRLSPEDLRGPLPNHYPVKC